MSKVAELLLLLFSLALAALRIAGERGQVFQAVAHLWLGGLCGAQVTIQTVRPELYAALPAARRWFFLLLGVAVLLSVVEVFCFFLLPR